MFGSPRSGMVDSHATIIKGYLTDYRTAKDKPPELLCFTGSGAEMPVMSDASSTHLPPVHMIKLTKERDRAPRLGASGRREVTPGGINSLTIVDAALGIAVSATEKSHGDSRGNGT
jgi:hypothetical protein